MDLKFKPVKVEFDQNGWDDLNKKIEDLENRLKKEKEYSLQIAHIITNIFDNLKKGGFEIDPESYIAIQNPNIKIAVIDDQTTDKKIIKAKM